jgi:hypothetical protein
MTDNVLEDAHLVLRKASIASVERRKPYNGILSSQFGGPGVGKADEALPAFNGKDMFCLLQVNLRELPYVPNELHNIALIVIFFNRDFIPVGRSHGDGWLIREYQTFQGLQLLPISNEISIVQNFPVRWSMVSDDTADIQTAWALSKKSISDDNNMNEMIEKGNYWFTKFGGFPCEINSKVNVENFVFQIRSEQKPKWMCDKNGILYFFKDRFGQWNFECQFELE